MTGQAAAERATPIDIVHVHEPFAPSVSAAALRHSHSLNVATFHAPQERVLSTQVARPLVEIFFGRIDARTVTSAATAELLAALFPGRLRAGRARRATAAVGSEVGAEIRSRLPAAACAAPRPDRRPGAARAGSLTAR